MKQLLTYGLLAATLLLAGCPYQSDVPIDKGSCSVPSWLPGKWQEIKQNGDGAVYDVKPDNSNASLLLVSSTAESFRKIYLSKIGNSVFISVYEPGDDVSDEGYYIFRLMKKSSTEIELLPVKEHADVAAAGSLKEFLRLHENDDMVYEKAELARYKKL